MSTKGGIFMCYLSLMQEFKTKKTASESEVMPLAIEKIKQLDEAIQPALEKVRASLVEQFPELEVEWHEVIPSDVDVEGEDGEWQAFALIDMRTVLKDETNKNYKDIEQRPASTRWSLEGEPEGETFEYLADADWSDLEPFEISKQVSAHFNLLRYRKTLFGRDIYCDFRKL
jgi:hypothetical protein